MLYKRLRSVFFLLIKTGDELQDLHRRVTSPYPASLVARLPARRQPRAPGSQHWDFMGIFIGKCLRDIMAYIMAYTAI